MPTAVAIRIGHLKYARASRTTEFITTALTLDGRAPVRRQNRMRKTIRGGTKTRARTPAILKRE